MNLQTYLETIDKKERAALIPIFIENGKGDIALMKPSDPKYGGSSFQVAKGIIEDGEDPKEAAIREGQQELGITNIHKGDLKLLWNDKKQGMYYYIVVVKNKILQKPKPNENGIIETESTVWWDLDKASKEMRDWQRKLIPMIKRSLGLS